ncbi:ubiquitin-conjugating enzyme E2 S [Chrysemys picta bellii]|uniref:ubiquitin-conjugating enzyme E2 S n=1 Tax=Chrysemys picta bellii TaxID=8478 RepID=UPI0032B112E6
MNSNVENLPPHVIRLVYKEVSTLTSDPPEGIKVFPNEEDITDVQVTIEGPEGTPYAGGVFRMKLILGKDFPAAPPKGYFLTKIFHPNVGANGEICVNVLKKDWKAELGIKHVLLVSGGLSRGRSPLAGRAGPRVTLGGAVLQGQGSAGGALPWQAGLALGGAVL